MCVCLSSWQVAKERKFQLSTRQNSLLKSFPLFFCNYFSSIFSLCNQKYAVVFCANDKSHRLHSMLLSRRQNVSFAFVWLGFKT